MDTLHIVVLIIFSVCCFFHSYLLFYFSVNIFFLAHVASAYSESVKAELYWEWDNGAPNRTRYVIDTNQIRFPKDFLWGVSSSSYQCEGGSTQSQWTLWENAKQADGTPRIHNGDINGQGVDHWNRVSEDIELMKDIGVNSSRFSLSWDKIQPTPSEFDEAALQHYHEELDALIAAGITPMITLHHFSHPIWFDNLGAFEKEENLAYFEAFSVRVFAEFSKKCQLWCTINEPEVFAGMGYLYAKFPPGRFDPVAYTNVLLNLMKAHVRVYFALKNHRLCQANTQIGIVKNIFQYDRLHPLDPIAYYFANRLDHLSNESILNFFANGEFKLNRLFGYSKASAHYVDKRAPQSLDFFGLNYYSHFHIKSTWSFPLPVTFTHRPHSLMTDMPYPIYAEGMYRAIMRCSRTLDKKIFITETGIADRKDQFRELFLRRYLYAVSRAIADGANVRGFFYWSLVSNFEWAEGWAMKFGLYEVPDRTTQKRVLYKGARYYSHVIAKSTGKKNKVVEEDEKNGLLPFV